MPSPPETPRRPVAQRRHGTEVGDPFRWLEDDDEAVREWIRAQNRYLDEHLDDDLVAWLRDRLGPLAECASYGTVRPRGGRYFQRIEAPDQDRPVLTVREDPAGEPRDLIDPNAWSGGRSVDWYVPSLDGSLVAYGVAEGGTEQYDLRIREVDTGEDVATVPSVGRTRRGTFAWWPDGSGFYYVATGDAGHQLERELRHRTLEGDQRVLASLDDPNRWPRLEVDPATETLFLAAVSPGGDTELSVLVDGGLEPRLTEADGELRPTADGGRIYVLTDVDAPRRRILAGDVAALGDGDPALDDLRTVVPETEAVLQGFALTDGHLVVRELVDAHARLAAYDREGNRRQTLAPDGPATIGPLDADPRGDECFLQREAPDDPPSVVWLRPARGSREVLQSMDVDVPSDLTVEQLWVDSTDGATVPVFVTRRSTAPLDGTAPALLTGYGGFRRPISPRFRRFALPFLRDGGTLATVCARGGFEFGADWHAAGRRADKQHTFDDFLAAGDALVERGYTDTDRLAVSGGSNGGLSVGAVLTQRPDLFGAAYAAVPLADMLRYDEHLLGEYWTDEYGDPADPADFAVLRAYSPYHNVEPDRSYPPTLLRTAESDTRVHPSHARKLAARLQDEADGGPFLLRTRTDAGHGPGTPTSHTVENELDRWTFLYQHLGGADGPPADRSNG